LVSATFAGIPSKDFKGAGVPPEQEHEIMESSHSSHPNWNERLLGASGHRSPPTLTWFNCIQLPCFLVCSPGLFWRNLPILPIPKVISGKSCRKTQYFRTVSPKVKQPNPIGLIVETQGHESLFTIKRLWEMGAWSGSVLTKLPKKKMGIYHRILGFNQQLITEIQPLINIRMLLYPRNMRPCFSETGFEDQNDQHLRVHRPQPSLLSLPLWTSLSLLS
jgi:hypothetical protein